MPTAPREGMMLRIVAPGFVAAVVLSPTLPAFVVGFAPIVKRMRGWTAARVLEHCNAVGWDVEPIFPKGGGAA